MAQLFIKNYVQISSLILLFSEFHFFDASIWGLVVDEKCNLYSILHNQNFTCFKSTIRISLSPNLYIWKFPSMIEHFHYLKSQKCQTNESLNLQKFVSHSTLVQSSCIKDVLPKISPEKLHTSNFTVIRNIAPNIN